MKGNVGATKAIISWRLRVVAEMTVWRPCNKMLSMTVSEAGRCLGEKEGVVGLSENKRGGGENLNVHVIIVVTGVVVVGVMVDMDLAANLLCPPGFRCGSEGRNERVDRGGTKFGCRWHGSHGARAQATTVLSNAERVHGAINKAWRASRRCLAAGKRVAGGKNRVGRVGRYLVVE